MQICDVACVQTELVKPIDARFIVVDELFRVNVVSIAVGGDRRLVPSAGHCNFRVRKCRYRQPRPQHADGEHQRNSVNRGLTHVRCRSRFLAAFAAGGLRFVCHDANAARSVPQNFEYLVHTAPCSRHASDVRAIGGYHVATNEMSNRAVLTWVSSPMSFSSGTPTVAVKPAPFHKGQVRPAPMLASVCCS